MRTLAVLACLLPIAALGQAERLPPFQLERLQFDPTAAGGLVTGSGVVQPPGGYRAFAAFHYERLPLLASRADQSGAVVGDRLTAHLGVSYGLFDRFEGWVQLAAVAVQVGDDLSGLGIASPSSAGFSSPVLGARYQLLRAENDRAVDVAAGLAVGLPLGSGDALSNVPGLSLAPSVSAGLDLGRARLSGELSAALQPAVTLGQHDVGSQLGLSLAASTLGDGLRGEGALRAALPLTSSPLGLELLAGARYPVGTFELFALGGFGVGKAPGTPQLRAIAGVAYAPRPTAAAPAPPPPAPAPALPPPAAVEAPTAPACVAGQPHAPADCPLLDLDGDGMPNRDDRCPSAAEDRDGFEDGDGCPDEDNDADSIADADDACPSEAGTLDRKGCPLRDADGDGVEDAVDACPAEAGALEYKGCKPADRDGDGVFDAVDNCPADPGPADNQGCPAKQKQLVVITREKLVIKDKVYFQSGKSALQPRSYPLLDQIARILVEHAEIPRVDVEGHTDNVGKADLNRKLSADRANAVRAYLIKKGVAPDRLTAKGYGPDRPSDTNDTQAGREANRRVEFILGEIEPKAGEP